MAEDEGPIRSLRERLYSRQRKDEGGIKRTPLKGEESDVRRDWEDVQTSFSGVPEHREMKQKKSFVSRFLVFSVIFFVGAVIIAVLIVGGRANIISSRNVDISVSGPVSVGGGEVLALQIEVKNKNRTTLEVADLLVEFPSGTRDASDLSKELVRFREALGDIKSGDKTTKTVEAVLFGEEGSKKDILITVEYRVAGSNAIFYKERKYEIEISSAPLNFSLSVPKEINAGQNIPLTVEVISNASSIIENVLLVVEYPFGFELVDGSPDPTFDDNVWVLGDIGPGGRRVIRITGSIEAQDEEERTFRFESGIVSERDEKKIGTPFISTLRSLVVKRPFISLDIALGGKVDDVYVARSGSSVRTDIVWVNNLAETINDAEITVRFFGVALDKSSVSVQNGFYRSIDNVVIWDKTGVPALGSISPGSTGRVTLDFSSFNLATRSDLKNPEILLDIEISGQRFGDPDVSGPVSVSRSKRVVFASDLGVVSRLVHFVGPFINSGPIPPRAERETTYTVVWSVTNSSNDLADGEVRATLPSYVRWLGVTSPVSEDIIFNPVGGEVIWRVGEVPAGTGFATPPIEAAFQVALVPSVSQINTQPVIVSGSTFTGFDRFAETSVSSSANSVTTRLSTDPQFSTGDGVVVE